MIPHIGWRWLRLLTAMLILTAALRPVNAAPTPNPQRIVAIGDLHGDHEVWIAIARAAGLIDPKGRWTGGSTLLVQTGDIVDRGPDPRRIIRDLMRLEREAPRAGGRVVVLVGNHEAMLVIGDMRYVHPGEYAAFADRESPGRRDAAYAAGRAAIEADYRRREATLSAAVIRARWLARTPLGKVEYQAAWTAQGELGRWIIARPAVARIGDTLFVHGGLSAAYARLPIDEINRRVTAALVARDTSPTSILDDPLGPLWYRGLAGMPPETASALKPVALPSVDLLLADVLAATGAKRIVIGHTPLLSGVAVTLNGRLVRVDSGNSRAYGGVPGFIEIVGDRATAHNVARPGKGAK